MYTYALCSQNKLQEASAVLFDVFNVPFLQCHKMLPFWIDIVNRKRNAEIKQGMGGRGKGRRILWMTIYLIIRETKEFAGEKGKTNNRQLVPVDPVGNSFVAPSPRMTHCNISNRIAIVQLRYNTIIKAILIV